MGNRSSSEACMYGRVSWQGMGYSAVIYIAALASVDTSQVEAAIIDGAGRFARVWNVDIPAIMPTIVIQLILAVGGI